MVVYHRLYHKEMGFCKKCFKYFPLVFLKRICFWELLYLISINSNDINKCYHPVFSLKLHKKLLSHDISLFCIYVYISSRKFTNALLKAELFYAKHFCSLLPVSSLLKSTFYYTYGQGCRQ